MAQEEVFTMVKKHQRSNPVKPGKHWVRKHPRFIGYRDQSEVRLLEPTHIADIQGVGGKTTTILAQEGYLTLEDAERLAQDPQAQQAMIDKGVRPHIMAQVVEATGVEPQREMIREQPRFPWMPTGAKPPPSDVFSEKDYAEIKQVFKDVEFTEVGYYKGQLIGTAIIDGEQVIIAVGKHRLPDPQGYDYYVQILKYDPEMEKEAVLKEFPFSAKGGITASQVKRREIGSTIKTMVKHKFQKEELKESEPEQGSEEAYPFARESKVENIGEDVEDSRRHRWWEKHYASIAEAEKAGVAHKLVTKQRLLEDLDLEAEQKAGKTAGHIYYHKKVQEAIKAKPLDTPEAREYYAKELQALEEIFDQSKNMAELTIKLQVHMKSKSREELQQFHDILGKNAYNLVTMNMYRSDATSRHISTGFNLESGEKTDLILPTGEVAHIRARKSTPQDYKDLPKFLKKKKRSQGKGYNLGELIKKFNKKMRRENLRKDAEREQKRFKFKSGEEAARRTQQYYNLRAIQYGNYVSDKDRLVHTKLTCGALYDLSNALQMKDSEVSMNGKLAMGIGARGAGHTKAHYEPKQDIINLTATKGNGELAHEYGHFLDHKLHEASTFHKEGEYRGASRYRLYKFRNTDDRELIKAVNALNEDIKYSAFVERSRKYGTYWASQEEAFARAFAAYTYDKTKNTYLALPNKGSVNDPIFGDVYAVYPQGPEREKLNKRFDAVFEAGKGKWDKL